MGIKPIKPESVIKGATYMFYSRIHTLTPATVPLRESLCEKGCDLIDYELIRDVDTGWMLVGSSWLAGKIGGYNAMWALGEALLLKWEIRT